MGVRHWLAAAVIVPVAAGLLRESTPNAATPAVTGQESTTLDDQVELSVTVYNSSLALVRDVRNLQLASGSFDLKFMDIAATVNPATVHFRSLTEPSRVSVLEQNYEYRPPRTRQAASQVRRPRRDAGSHATGRRNHTAGRGESASPQLQQRPGLADRRRDRDRIERRSHPLP